MTPQRIRIRKISNLMPAIAGLLVVSVVASVHAETHEEAAATAAKLFENNFAIDDVDPEHDLPSEAARNAKPVDFGYYLMELGERAETATKKGEHAAAVKYYRALAAAVPDRSIAFSKLCEAYEAAGGHDNAEQSCALALSRSGVKLEDYQRYVAIVLEAPKALSTAQIKNVDTVLEHLKTQSVAPALQADLACQLGARIKDAPRLRSCLAVLTAQGVTTANVLRYRWALALVDSDYATALRLSTAAQVALGDDAARDMRNETLQAMPAWRRFFVAPEVRVLAPLMAALCIGLLLLLRRALQHRKVLSH